MESSVPYVVAVLIVLAVAFGLTMIMRSVNRNRSRGGMMLAATAISFHRVRVCRTPAR